MFTHKNVKQVVVCYLMLLNIKQEIIISQGFRDIGALKRLTLESMLGKYALGTIVNYYKWQLDIYFLNINLNNNKKVIGLFYKWGLNELFVQIPFLLY